MTKRRITVGHSPDPDDAFMFYALAHDKIDTGDLQFRHELQDIETLNRRALKGELEVTAISLHAYAFLLDKYAIFPGSHYVTPQQQMRKAIESIREELRDRLDFYDKAGRFLEKQRLEQRTMYDLEMMEQMGFCQGIENYSRHLSGRMAGEPPPTLLDYFPKEFLLVIDGGVSGIVYPTIRTTVPPTPSFTTIFLDPTLFAEYRPSNTIGINTTLRYSATRML